MIVRKYPIATIFLRRLESSRKIVLLGCVFSFLFSSNNIYGQWKKIAQFDFPSHAIYFQDSTGNPKIGFCGTGAGWLSLGTGGAKIWRTSDGGKSWAMVADFGGGANVNDFTFKDSLTGWVSLFSSRGSFGLSNFLKTTDGGLTWFDLPRNDPELSWYCSDIYYHKYSQRLILSIDDASSMYSLNDGLSWARIIAAYNNGMYGIAFADSLTGLISGDWNKVGITGPDLITTDGGITWKSTATGTKAWQPLGIKNSKTFFEIGGFTHPNYVFQLWDVYRSDDGGATWRVVGSVGPGTSAQYLTGTIAGDLNKLYVQSGEEGTSGLPLGIHISEDQGATWNLMCGPGGMIPSRFFVKDNFVYAGDAYGGLYLNTTGKANGPRLQLEKNNLIRHTSAVSGSIIPIDVYYLKEDYYENVDSLAIILAFNDGMVFDHDSAADGWKVKRREVTNTNVKIVLERTDPSSPKLGSFVLRAYCQAVVSKEQTGIVTLDEINFNQDVSYHDCMVSALSATDSFYVDIKDQCGDSILRQFITKGTIPMKIVSIRPNPAQDDIDIEINSLVKQDAMIELRNALGVKVYSDARNFIAGKNSIRLGTKALSSGMYLVRVVSAGGEANQSLVVSH